MPFTVELYPSGHRFEARSGETILEAALRAGRSPAFGCANGSCGECRARIVAGDVERVRFHDYVIADAEKRAGYALLCSTAPCSDLVVESTEASGVDDIAPQRVRTRVTRIEHASADHAVVHLKIRRARVLRYLAGQRATVRFENGPARESWLASCPCDAVNLRFHVRRDPEDAFAAHVFDAVGRGVNAAVEGPSGRFVLDDSSPRALLFVAFGTGFAPIESLIEHAINLELDVPIRLVRVFRSGACRTVTTTAARGPMRSTTSTIASWRRPPMPACHCTRPRRGSSTPRRCRTRRSAARTASTPTWPDRVRLPTHAGTC